MTLNQKPAPAQPSYSMQDSSLKPVLPGELQGVGIDQKLDAQAPLNLLFKDEAGRDVPLSHFFESKKPVLLALVYYRCPMLCTQILTGVESSLKAVSFNPGQDFEVVSVSIASGVGAMVLQSWAEVIQGLECPSNPGTTW